MNSWIEDNAIHHRKCDVIEEPKLNNCQVEYNQVCSNDDDKAFQTELLTIPPNQSQEFQKEVKSTRLLPVRKVFTELVLRELRFKWQSIAISISTVILLLFFLTLMNVAMGVSPLIYLMISEKEHTESDVIFYNPQISLNENDANSEINQFLIDYKAIKEQYCDIYLQGCASRFTSKAQHSIDSVEFQNNFLLIDIVGEQHANLGRRIVLDPLNVNGECYVSEEIFKLLREEQNDKLDGKYQLVLEITLELMLAQIPGLQSEITSRSTELKQHFIANYLFNYFKAQGLDYSTSNELLAELLKQSQLPQQIIQLLINNFNLDKFLHTPIVHGESKQRQQYGICLSVSSFMLQLKAQLNLSTRQTIPQGSGKFADNMSRIVVMDYVTQREWILEQISQTVIEDFLEKLKEDSLSIYFSLLLEKKELQKKLFNALNQLASKEFFENKAMVMSGVFKDKITAYLSEDSIIQAVKLSSNRYSDVFSETYPTQITFPLAIAQTNKLRQKVILDSSYNAGVFLLVVLSSTIIYSVSEASISQQIQEYGILRIIGSSVKSLLAYTLFKTTIFYIIPSLILSSTLNQLLIQSLYQYFSNLLSLQQSSQLDSSISFLGTTLFIGIVLPLICNLMPFKTFLDKQVLSQALHAHSRILNQTKVFVQKLEKYGISPYALINSLILISIGILAYYFAPYAFITKNMGMFLLIVNITFLMVNAGISLLMNLIQRWIEQGFIKILLKTICCKDSNLSAAIMNNFKNNKTRMKKVGMIILMIFSFYISIGSNVNSQVQTIKNIVKLNIGSDYVLQSTIGQALDEETLTQELEKFKQLHNGVIKSYSFVSMKMSSIIYFFRLGKAESYTSNSDSWDCVAIDPQFYDSIYNELFIPDSQQFRGQNPSNSLYNENKTSIGMFNESETLLNKDPYLIQSIFWSQQFISYKDLAEHQNEQNIRLYISIKEKNSLQLDYGNYIDLTFGFTRYRASPVGFAQKLPGFSSFTQNELLSFVNSESIVLISQEQFLHIMTTSWKVIGNSDDEINQLLTLYPNSTNNVPKTKLFVKLVDDLEIADSERNELKGILLSQNSQSGNTERPKIELLDTHMIFVSLEYLFQFWNVIFHLISVFIFILSYYLLTITFKSNVQENMQNIRIYKSLGLNHQAITKIFVIEGLSVMLVNGILGVIVGLLLSVMIQQQVVIFLEIAQDLSTVPYEITLILLVMCVFLSIFISKREIDAIKQKSISEIGQ